MTDTYSNRNKNILNIQYFTNRATEQNIFSYLLESEKNFIPPLNERIELTSYSCKIFNGSKTFEAWIDNSLIGLLAAYFNDPEKKRGYITTLSVLKSYMRLGISTELLKNCVKYARRHQYTKIDLEVDKRSLAALHLYKKFGFCCSRSFGYSLFMSMDLKPDLTVFSNFPAQESA